MTRYRRSADATERRVGSGLFLSSAARGSIYRVNETVAALWRLLAKPLSVEEAVGVFADAFPDEAPDRVRADVETMLDDLLDEGLVERVE